MLGTVVPGACIILSLGVLFILWRHKTVKHRRLDKNTSSDIVNGTYFGVHVFSYKELQDATHNFDSSKELGEGGFGTVYYGKLRDGREVAVKRCYENNYRRVEQFMNEIHILTLLRHRNLVLLSSPHLSAPKQTKWWYAKRFLHPDIVAPYDYIFIWDEDLGVDNFDPEEYIRLVKKYGLDISQPGLSPDSKSTWRMTRKQDDSEVHKLTEERPGWCQDPHLPPCAAFIEIMAPVFSRNAWRCAWHLIQNDLVHGWGVDFALRKCVEPAHEKIGVVDSQWIVHASIPTLGNQGVEGGGRTRWEMVRERCRDEWATFQNRFIDAERYYYESKGIDVSNYTSSIGGGHIHSRKFDVDPANSM